MASPEVFGSSLVDYRWHVMSVEVRLRALDASEAAAVAGKWAMRHRYPACIPKWDPGAETISRLAGIPDRVELTAVAWQLRRNVGAFAIAAGLADDISSAANDMGHDVYGIAMGRDEEASLYMAAPGGKTPDSTALKEVVDRVHKQLGADGVPLRLPVPRSLVRVDN